MTPSEVGRYAHGASSDARRRGARAWLDELERLDVATYAAIARSQTPLLDAAMSRLSRAADYSKLSLGGAAVLAVLGGRRGRRAAAFGLASVGVTATVVNVALKPLGRRERPDRVRAEVPIARHVPMPISTSFPSGHSAAAFAFATGAGHVLPLAGLPLRLLAALVAYSRVHTGVHYPVDVIAGALLGGAFAQLTTHALERHGAVSVGAAPASARATRAVTSSSARCPRRSPAPARAGR